jgi:hypothetical protein
LPGAVCWLAYRAARGAWAEVPLFYLAVLGIAMFLGNVLSAAFVGDFSNAAVAADLAMPTRLAITTMGGLGLGLVAAYRRGTRIRIRGQAGTIAAFAIIQFGAMWLSIQPFVASR